MATVPISVPEWLAQTPQPCEGPVILSGQRYLLRLMWSPRAGWAEDAGIWLITLLDARGEVIAPAVPLVLTSDLWASYRDDPRTPSGAFEVVRLTGSGDPGPTDLGVAVVLRYTTA
jgi:hypothetical protein